MAVLLLLDAALLLYMGRELTFFYDDWDFVIHDFGGGLHSLLAAHVGNISVFPVAAYKLLFHLVGLNHYTVFRLAVVVLHLLAAGLIFTLASRRIANVPALLATALILFMGAAWEDLLWAFQIGYLLSIVGGLAAWRLLERRDRVGDLLAMGCLVLAVGSSSLGIPLIVGITVELAWRRDWSRGFVIVAPALLYGAWYLGYGESEVTSGSLINAPGFAVDLAAAAVGALVGRGLDWGRPLALLGLLVLLRRLSGATAISARLAGLLATGLALWVVTATARSTTSAPETSRYVYLGAVVVVLIGIELLRGFTVTPRTTAMATVLVGLGAITGLTALNSGASSLRSTSKTVAAELGALEIASAYAPAGYQPDSQRAPQIAAGPYLHTVRAIGSSPADSPSKIVSADAGSRAAADGVLLALEAPKLVPYGNTTERRPAPAPQVSELVGGRQTQHGGCVELSPMPGASMNGVILMPRNPIAIGDGGSAPATLALRRFGDGFIPIAAAIAPRSTVRLTIPSDSAPELWDLQIASSSALSVCTAVG